MIDLSDLKSMHSLTAFKFFEFEKVAAIVCSQGLNLSGAGSEIGNASISRGRLWVQLPLSSYFWGKTIK